MGFWHYSTNLQSALGLAEKVSNLNGEETEVTIKICSGKNFCRVTSNGKTNSDTEDYVKGKTIQEAICLAVLKYSGIKVV